MDITRVSIIADHPPSCTTTVGRDAGYHPIRAWICRDWAEALLAKGSDENTKRVKLLLDEGSRISERLGMKPLLGNIEDLRKSCASAVGRSYPDGLTEREVEVLGLISKGKTNQEIARILFLSKNTIMFHRYNIRTKLGIKNKRINLSSHLSSFDK